MIPFQANVDTQTTARITKTRRTYVTVSVAFFGVEGGSWGDLIGVLSFRLSISLSRCRLAGAGDFGGGDGGISGEPGYGRLAVRAGGVACSISPRIRGELGPAGA